MSATWAIIILGVAGEQGTARYFARWLLLCSVANPASATPSPPGPTRPPGRHQEPQEPDPIEKPSDDPEALVGGLQAGSVSLAIGTAHAVRLRGGA